ncbi:Outer membrane receptor proteins, mostly Fe transport [bacterium A37T11]|nr:Outer membrane receptor proteins, mostly Fe transport [bacterium A37T11]
MKYSIAIFFLLLAVPSKAQYFKIDLKLTDAISNTPISGALISTNGSLTIAVTDENGLAKLIIKNTVKDSLRINALGYFSIKMFPNQIMNTVELKLSPKSVLLEDVNIAMVGSNPFHVLSHTDIKLRSIANSQEVLRIIPGLFIAQHQGGGKAEQLFLRGFDNDHGTDLLLSVDGMPINMVSHAHGQGYADSHFIIPETIESTNYEKGMYNVTKGDLAVSGFAEFHTTNILDKNVLKVEAGQFNTYRALTMFNLLPLHLRNQQSWYLAGEYRYSNGYFEHSQDFDRINVFTKYHGKIGENSWLSLSASTFHSTWKASGQIPESAVKAGIVDFYGSLDPNEGGITGRTNVNMDVIRYFSNGDIWHNQLYYSRYTFDLSSNFTFFLDDPVNGDEILQREKRNLLGYHGKYTHLNSIGHFKATSTAGWETRIDLTKGSELSHTVNRYTLIEPIKLGNIYETQIGFFYNENILFSSKLSADLGLRFDYLHYQYNNKLPDDPTLYGEGIYKSDNNIFSPKLKVMYQATGSTQLYWLVGRGFHSNDARGVVTIKQQSLPSAIGTDVGIVMKPVSNLLINAAIWYSKLQNEYVYSGDGGSVAFSGKTRRIGIDVSGRYQAFSFLYVDMDLNYAHGRAVDESYAKNYIPLAPVWTSTGGITWMLKSGLNGSFRYRYLADRPANEDYSLKANGYLINDLVINYTERKFELGISVNNLFAVRWKEAQFATETRLPNQDPITSIAFTPGTKFSSLLHFSWFF